MNSQSRKLAMPSAPRIWRKRISPEEAGGGSESRQGDARRGRQGKLLSPERRRSVVNVLRKQVGVSERRACRVVKQPRTTHRYQPMLRPDKDSFDLNPESIAVINGRITGDPFYLAWGFSVWNIYTYVAVVSRWAQQDSWRPENIPKVEKSTQAVCTRSRLSSI